MYKIEAKQALLFTNNTVWRRRCTHLSETPFGSLDHLFQLSTPTPHRSIMVAVDPRKRNGAARGKRKGGTVLSILIQAIVIALASLLTIVLWYSLGPFQPLSHRLTGKLLHSPQEDSNELYKRRPMTLKTPLASCTNIHCDTDEGCTDIECGGLWRGERLATSKSSGQFKSVAFVISHCLHNLDWVASFTRGTTVHSITIITKCNATIAGAPPDADIIVLPNVGRCDHSYAHWIRHNYVSTGNSPDVVVFLKDERSNENIHQAGYWASLPDMLHTAYEQGFACGMRPTSINRDGVFYLSAYHDTAALMEFAKKEYGYQSERYGSNKVDPFESKFENMGAWVKDMRLPIPQNLMQACYGGSFAVSLEAIRSHEETVWIKLLDSLARGDSIEEGHFAERIWAGLLADPPTPYEITLLRNYSCCVANYTDSYVGTLKREI
jgi:Protein of unknown function (DUF3431)